MNDKERLSKMIVVRDSEELLSTQEWGWGGQCLLARDIQYGYREGDYMVSTQEVGRKRRTLCSNWSTDSVGLGAVASYSAYTQGPFTTQMLQPLQSPKQVRRHRSLDKR